MDPKQNKIYTTFFSWITARKKYNLTLTTSLKVYTSEHFKMFNGVNPNTFIEKEGVSKQMVALAHYY